MGIFLILVGLILFMVGIFKLLNKKSKTAKKTKWMIFGAGVLVMLIGTITTGNASVANQKKLDSTPTSAEQAKPTLAALAASNIEKMSGLDGVKVNDSDIENVVYQGKRKDKATGKIYKHVYYMIGKYRYNGRQTGFNMTFNFDRNNIRDSNVKYQVLQYGNDDSSMSGTFTSDLSADTE